MTEDKTQLQKEAIAQAAQGNWEQAIATNLQIIESFPDDVPTLNRLGRAYTATSNHTNAKQAYEKVLELDPDNTIAYKNLAKLNRTQGQSSSSSKARTLNPDQFVKHSGRSKIVSLTNLAAVDIRLQINSGDYVQLVPRKRQIIITNIDGKKLGRLPDDVNYRLLQLINLGYEYAACVKCSDSNRLQILIQEIFKPQGTSHVSFFTK